MDALNPIDRTESARIGFDRRSITEEEKRALVTGFFEAAKVKGGVKVAQRKYRTSIETISRWALELGIEIPDFRGIAMAHATKLTPEMREEIIGLKGKLGAYQIASKYGVHNTSVYKVWREAGLLKKRAKPMKENSSDGPKHDMRVYHLPLAGEVAQSTETSPAVKRETTALKNKERFVLIMGEGNDLFEHAMKAAAHLLGAN